jgi:hypothetical protein
MTAPRPVEDLCAVTGKPCRWLSDDQYENGEIVAWDLFCQDCFRERDWDKDEASETAPLTEATG